MALMNYVFFYPRQTKQNKTLFQWMMQVLCVLNQIRKYCKPIFESFESLGTLFFKQAKESPGKSWNPKHTRL